MPGTVGPPCCDGMNTIVSDARRIASPEAAQEFAHAQKLPIDDAMIAARTGGHLRRPACGRSSAPVPCGWRLLGPETPGGGAVDVAVQRNRAIFGREVREGFPWTQFVALTLAPDDWHPPSRTRLAGEPAEP